MITTGPVTHAVACLVCIVSCGSRLGADPIRAVFNIQVVGRATEPSAAPEPFDVSFPLTVTFDDGVLGKSEGCCSSAVVYGDPTFGRVPLPHTGIPPGIQPFDNHGSSGHWGTAADGTFFRGISLIMDLSFDPATGGSSGNYFILSVFGFEDGLSSRPSLDPRSLLLSVRPSGFENFDLQTGRHVNGELVFNRYVGFATLVSDEVPVPEPCSLLLVGTGLAGLGLHVRRYKGTQQRKRL